MKRPFAELADSEDDDDDPESDELYGWAQEDEVAAEGLLIFDQPPSVLAVPAASPASNAQGLNAAAGGSDAVPG